MALPSHPPPPPSVFPATLDWGSGRGPFADVETEVHDVTDSLQVTLADRGAEPEASRNGGGELVWIQILAFTPWLEEDHEPQFLHL